MLPSLLQVREAAGGVARFSFSELCDENRGAADYLAIAQHFHTVFLSNVPVMSLQVRIQPLPSSKHADATCNDSSMVACSAAVENVSCGTLTSDQVYFLGSSEAAYAPVGMDFGREAWRDRTLACTPPSILTMQKLFWEIPFNQSIWSRSTS